MRILLFTASGDLGGGKTHILSLAKELNKINDLRLVCFRIGELSKEAAEMGIDTVVVDQKAGFAAARATALEQARIFKPDIVDVSSGVEGKHGKDKVRIDEFVNAVRNSAADGR